MPPSTFTITASMEERWVPHFLGMLRFMEWCGQVGASRRVSFYADGDGDFHPSFEWTAEPQPADPVGGNPDEPMWDAG